MSIQKEWQLDIKDILQTVQHRPFPLPTEPWVMTQIWHTLLFAHWPLASEALRPLIPNVLTLDTFDDQAWVSITPFFMTHVRPRGVPPFPWLSQFAEINVRTYVTMHDIPGSYFFSLDAGNPIAVALARTIFHLPYFHAHMSCRLTGETIYYQSHRRHGSAPPADFRASYRPIGSITYAQPDTLEYWLVERYCLYTFSQRDRLYRVTIHHRPWPLQAAEAEITWNTMAISKGIPLPNTAPLLHYAQRQEVLVWPIHRVFPSSAFRAS